MRCKGCYYYRSLSQGQLASDKCCHYLIDTGKMRKIPPELCYKHENTPYLKREREPRSWGVENRSRRGAAHDI